MEAEILGAEASKRTRRRKIEVLPTPERIYDWKFESKGIFQRITGIYLMLTIRDFVLTIISQRRLSRLRSIFPLPFCFLSHAVSYSLLSRWWDVQPDILVRPMILAKCIGKTTRSAPSIYSCREGRMISPHSDYKGAIRWVADFTRIKLAAGSHCRIASRSYRVRMKKRHGRRKTGTEGREPTILGKKSTELRRGLRLQRVVNIIGQHPKRHQQQQ